jgi:transposase
MDLNTASRSELIALILDLRDKIELLEIKIVELQANKQKDSDTPPTSPLPSWVKLNTKKKKRKNDRKKREHGFSRKRSVPDRQVFHSFSSCPNCGGEQLGKPAVAYTREVIEIPIIPFETIEHVIFKRWCFTCKKRVCPHIDLSSSVVGNQRFGNRLTGMVGLFREVFRNPIETIQSYFEMVYHLSLSQGAIVGLLHKTAKTGRPTYEGLKEQIRESSHIHGDETGWREDGKNGYIWNFNTPQVKIILYRKTRSHTVVEEMLGEDFTGVLVTDFYTAYNAYHGFHQRCWVHYLRDIKKLKEDNPTDKQLKKWSKQIQKIYEDAKVYKGPDPALPVGIKNQERITMQKEFENRLRMVCEPWVKQEVPMNTLSARAIRFLQEMFVFIRFEGVPSDNNPAERSIRPTVTARKISGGTRSAKGSETRAILSSLFGTWKLQNKNPLEQCQFLLASCQ